MFYLKTCPKCKGDLYTDSDRYGWFISCLNCGYCCDVASMAEATNDSSGPKMGEGAVGALRA